MEHTALIYVMVLMSAADSDMTDRELYTMGEIVRVLPVFRDYNTDLLPQAAADCAEILAQDDGLDAVIEVVNESLPSNLRETAYALACDIAAVEGQITGAGIDRQLFHPADVAEIDGVSAAGHAHRARRTRRQRGAARAQRVQCRRPECGDGGGCAAGGPTSPGCIGGQGAEGGGGGGWGGGGGGGRGGGGGAGWGGGGGRRGRVTHG